jgi:hypothetical protein
MIILAGAIPETVRFPHPVLHRMMRVAELKASLLNLPEET